MTNVRVFDENYKNMNNLMTIMMDAQEFILSVECSYINFKKHARKNVYLLSVYFYFYVTFSFIKNLKRLVYCSSTLL